MIVKYRIAKLTNVHRNGSKGVIPTVIVTLTYILKPHPINVSAMELGQIKVLFLDFRKPISRWTSLHIYSLFCFVYSRGVKLLANKLK